MEDKETQMVFFLMKTVCFLEVYILRQHVSPIKNTLFDKFICHRTHNIATFIEQQNISRYGLVFDCNKSRIATLVNTQKQSTICYGRISSTDTRLWQQTCRLFLHFDSWLAIKELLSCRFSKVREMH